MPSKSRRKPVINVITLKFSHPSQEQPQVVVLRTADLQLADTRTLLAFEQFVNRLTGSNLHIDVE